VSAETQPLTLNLASRIVDGALRAAREQGLKPLAVVVLDAGGHDVVLKREDGCAILRSDIARGKAWGALGMGVGSRELGRRAEQNPRFFSRRSLLPAAAGSFLPRALSSFAIRRELCSGRSASVATTPTTTRRARSPGSMPRAWWTTLGEVPRALRNLLPDFIETLSNQIWEFALASCT
jgi:uncharacterized protein GlcG (DUF336 family)